MAQYKLAHIDMKGNRGELHDLLNLTGAEVSCNTLPAGASVPFVHHHTQNEEVYLILEGKGMLYIDGEELPLKEGDCFRIDPQGGTLPARGGRQRHAFHLYSGQSGQS